MGMSFDGVLLFSESLIKKSVVVNCVSVNDDDCKEDEDDGGNDLDWKKDRKCSFKVVNKKNGKKNGFIKEDVLVVVDSDSDDDVVVISLRSKGNNKKV